jgi:hypothetical protein
MRARRYWIEIVSLCTAVSCGLALLIVLGVSAVAAAQSSAAPPAASSETYEGVVTDIHCGAKHQASIRKNAADCARSCVHAGSQFALVDGDKTYILTGDPERLKEAAGRRVKVAGTLTGETIAVTLITPAS